MSRKAEQEAILRAASLAKKLERGVTVDYLRKAAKSADARDVLLVDGEVAKALRQIADEIESGKHEDDLEPT
jgi:hypothetical protein